MKKLLLAVVLMVSSLCANAFEFDGIDLNAPYSKVTQEIAKRGYIYNHEMNCLQGDCHGVTIFLSINYIDVKTQGMLGQLIVEIPDQEENSHMYEHAIMVLDVLYHRIPTGTEDITYHVASDGTQLAVSRKEGFIVLTYNTSNYEAPKVK